MYETTERGGMSPQTGDNRDVCDDRCIMRPRNTIPHPVSVSHASGAPPTSMGKPTVRPRPCRSYRLGNRTPTTPAASASPVWWAGVRCAGASRPWPA